MLKNAGFGDVYSMSGGMHAWDGITAEGAPEAGMAYFTDAHTAEELIGLAWLLEEGSRRYYGELPGMLDDEAAADLFRELSADEEHHKARLSGLYEGLTGAAFDEKRRKALASPDEPGGRMEGGIMVSEALDWSGGRDLKSLLEFAISLEANALDLYIKMNRRLRDEGQKKVFALLSDAERHHMERMASLLEKQL